MKTLELKLDIEKLNLGEEGKKQSVQTIISNVIQNEILSYAQQTRGFNELERRQYYKIADALEESAKSNSETVNLDDDLMGFLRKCFRETKTIPNALMRQVEELVSQVPDR
jgi:hypothetical protein